MLEKAGLEDEDDGKNDLTFTPRDSANVIKIKNDMSSLLLTIKEMASQIQDLKSVKTSNNPPITGTMSAVRMQVTPEKTLGSPSTLTFEAKRRMFGSKVSQEVANPPL